MKEETKMGVHREFSFEDDIELLNLKYQMNNGNFMDYFQDTTKEIGVKEENNIEKKKQQL